MEAGAAGGACGRLSFELELARLDFANHNGRTASWARACRSRTWRTCSTVDALAETEYGRLQYFKVVRPEQHDLDDLTTRVKIEVTYNGAKIADWVEVNVPERRSLSLCRAIDLVKLGAALNKFGWMDTWIKYSIGSAACALLPAGVAPPCGSAWSSLAHGAVTAIMGTTLS